MAVAATHGGGVVPGRARPLSAAVVTRYGADTRRAVVTRVRSHDALIEDDFDPSVAVQSTHHFVARKRVARGAREAAFCRRGRAGMRRMRSRSEPAVGKQACIARREAYFAVAVTRPAREDAPGLIVTRGACGGAWRSRRHSGRARSRTLVAPPAHVRIVRIEHGAPALIAQHFTVPAGGAGVGDVGGVNDAAERGRASCDPRREERSFLRTDKVPMGLGVEHAQDGRSCVARADGGHRTRPHTRHHIEVRGDAPSRCRSLARVTWSASSVENRRDIPVEDWRRSLHAPFLGAGRETERGCGDGGDPSPRTRRGALSSHCGRMIVVGGSPVMAKYASKISWSVYLGLCAPREWSRATTR